MRPRAILIALPYAATLLIAPSLRSQAPAPTQPAAEPAKAQADQTAQHVTTADRRRAARLFLDAGKLYQKERFLDAMRAYREAARLDPGNRDYALAGDVARSHAVEALVQAAAKARLLGNAGAERKAIEDGLALEPDNPVLTQHLDEMRDLAAGDSRPSPAEQKLSQTAGVPQLAIREHLEDFHLHQPANQAIRQVFKAYGIEATVDSSIRSTQVRLDLDQVGFAKAVEVLGMVTQSFYVPLDEHRVLVARDTRENRQNFQRQEVETVYLFGLGQTEMTDLGNLAKNVFELQQAVVEPTAGTISVRGPTRNLEAFNGTLRQLMDGHSQVMLDVQMIQLARTRDRNTGVIPPQSISAFNVYTEANSILNANQDLVNQIIQQGLASAGDTMKILLLLLASGQVTDSLVSNGFLLFGGGTTLSALQPGSVAAKLSLNSSESRTLDKMQLRLGDGEAATIRSGSRYPIQTSSFSSLGVSNSALAGLTGAGNSSSLAGLLSSYSSGYNVPQVEYQDLGLTLKATPKVMRGDLVSLSIEMKIDALSGGSLNGNPILDNRAYTGVVTLKPDEAAVVVSELSQTESRAISGVPGLSEIPGLNESTGKEVQKDYASLLVVMTPHVIRGIENSGRSPRYRIERGQMGR